MDRAVIAEIERLAKLSVAELKIHYTQVLGETPQSTNKDFLFRRIAWRLQANAQGDFSDRARRRAVEIADDADLRTGGLGAFHAQPGSNVAPVSIDRSQPQRDCRLT